MKLQSNSFGKKKIQNTNKNQELEQKISNIMMKNLNNHVKEEYIEDEPVKPTKGRQQFSVKQEYEAEQIPRTQSGIKKKKKKSDLPPPETIDIRSISYPEQVTSQKSKQLFQVHILWKLKGVEMKWKKRTVRFGHQGKENYVENKDEYKRNAILNKLQNTHNPLHPNFWKAHILNGSHATIGENYIATRAWIKFYNNRNQA